MTGSIILGAMLAVAIPPAGPLRIEIANVRSGAGRVHVDICTAVEFLKDCVRATTAPARRGTVVATLGGLPPGRYAAQIYHDENGNGQLDRAVFGIPKEGVGFSNDAPIRMAPPTFAAAAFDYPGGARTIRMTLRYFLGAKGPTPLR